MNVRLFKKDNNCGVTILIISKKSWNTGNFASPGKGVIGNLLLLQKAPWNAQHRESQTFGQGGTLRAKSGASEFQMLET